MSDHQSTHKPSHVNQLVGAGALAWCSSVHVISSVHIVVGAQTLTAAASGCSPLLLLPHTPDSAWLPRGNTF